MPLPISPPISVIIPAFNATSYLREAIASVRTEVGDRAEIIVVDDGSSDDTAAIAEAHTDIVTCIRRIRRGGAGERGWVSRSPMPLRGRTAARFG